MAQRVDAHIYETNTKTIPATGRRTGHSPNNQSQVGVTGARINEPADTRGRRTGSSGPDLSTIRDVFMPISTKDLFRASTSTCSAVIGGLPDLLEAITGCTSLQRDADPRSRMCRWTASRVSPRIAACTRRFSCR